jgi:hypothetical protein
MGLLTLLVMDAKLQRVRSKHVLASCRCFETSTAPGGKDNAECDPLSIHEVTLGRTAKGSWLQDQEPSKLG